jgi:hypothetical protein
MCGPVNDVAKGDAQYPCFGDKIHAEVFFGFVQHPTAMALDLWTFRRAPGAFS